MEEVLTTEFASDVITSFDCVDRRECVVPYLFYFEVRIPYHSRSGGE